MQRRRRRPRRRPPDGHRRGRRRRRRRGGGRRGRLRGRLREHAGRSSPPSPPSLAAAVRRRRAGRCGAIGPDRETRRGALREAPPRRRAAEHGRSTHAHRDGRARRHPRPATPCAAWRSPRTACASSSTTPSCAAAAPSGCASASSTSAARRCATSTSSTTKRMHLIVARRDLTGFQHLHPEQAADGSWTRRCGSTRPAPTACSPTSPATDEPTRSRADLRVDGARRPAAAARPAADGGQRRRLRRPPRRAAGARPGEEAELRFTITKDGQAGAHRALPRRRRPPRRAARGRPRLPARAPDRARARRERRARRLGRLRRDFPTAGRYRLFLQFKHEGRVQTVAFTQEVK